MGSRTARRAPSPLRSRRLEFPVLKVNFRPHCRLSLPPNASRTAWLDAHGELVPLIASFCGQGDAYQLLIVAGEAGTLGKGRMAPHHVASEAFSRGLQHVEAA